MKKVPLFIAIAIVAVLVIVPLAARFVGPKMIYVSPPSGTPIGEFDFPRPETSVLGVSIKVPMTILNDLINKEVPEQFQGQEQTNITKRIQNGGYAWAVARGKIEFQNTGTNLAFAAPFTGAARFQGDLDAKILTLPLDSTAELSGMGGGILNPVITPDWQIDPNLVPQLNLTNASLSLGALGTIDISDILGGTLGQMLQSELGKLAPALGQELDLRSEVEPLWREVFLNQSVSEDPPVWISITPEKVLMAPIDYSDPSQILINMGIQSETFLTNRDPGQPLPQPLPQLTPLDYPIDTNLRIPLIVGISELNEALASQTFEFDTGVGTRIEIAGMEAEIGQEGRLNLKLILQADKSRLGRGVSGEIWVTGRPLIDVENQSLGFSDVELTVETRDKLTTAAAWLLEGILVRTLESQLRVDLDDYKEEIDEEVQKALQSENLPEGLDVTLENLNVGLADIYTITRYFAGGEPDPGIVIVVSATGSMKTTLSPALFQPQ